MTLAQIHGNVQILGTDPDQISSSPKIFIHTPLLTARDDGSSYQKVFD